MSNFIIGLLIALAIVAIIITILVLITRKRTVTIKKTTVVHTDSHSHESPDSTHKEHEVHEEHGHSTKHGFTYIWPWSLAIILAIILFVTQYSSCERDSDEETLLKLQKELSDPQENNKLFYGEFTTTPRDTTYYLTKGKIFRILIPDGYKLNLYGGGKKYYHQAQNSPAEIWGGGVCNKKGNPNAKYVDIFYYNEEISVSCEFEKI